MTSSSAVHRTETADIAGLQAPAAWFDVEAWARATAAPGDRFDEAAAAHVCAFFPRYLRHSKGRWAGQPVVLEDWQRALLRTAFGWKRADGTRRFRIIFVEIARKNGKTTLAAGVALYLAFGSGEPGAEVYCAANDKDQARIAFHEAQRMRAQAPALKERTENYKDNISAPASFSKLEPLSAEAMTKDGLNISGLLYDEIHASKDRGLYDVLHTATGAREQPMEFIITTAGDDELSLWGEMHGHAEAVRDGVLKDHEFLPFICAADPAVAEKAFTDPALWPAVLAAANPSLGVTVKLDDLLKEAERATQMASARPAFLRLRCNVRSSPVTSIFPIEDWKAGNRGAETVTLSALRGRPVYLGIDLSAVSDVTAVVAAASRADGGVDVAPMFFLPEHDLDKRAARDRVPYVDWARDGLITLTEGNVIDPRRVRRYIRETLAPALDIREIAYDRWGAGELTINLTEDGFVCVPIGQGYASLSEPTKALQRLVMRHQLNAGGNPVLEWMARVVTAIQDEAGNIKPVKPDRMKSSKRIDGIVALIMALSRLNVAQAPVVPGIAII